MQTPCDADFLQAMRDHANGAAVEPPTLDPPVIEMPEPEPEPEPEEQEEEEETEEEEVCIPYAQHNWHAHMLAYRTSMLCRDPPSSV